MNFIGNTKIVAFFNQAIENKQLSHAYCLVGPKQIGKATLANELSAQLLNLSFDKLVSSPDYYWLKRGINEKTDKLRKNINIEQIRSLKAHLNNKSWNGGYRIAIIDGAQYLNSESGNALLKILEEGGDNLLFFLLTTNDNLLLPTIRSRCQLFFLSSVNNETIKNYLIGLGCSVQDADKISKLSFGLPGRAYKLYKNKELLEQYEINITKWKTITQLDFGARLKMFPDLYKGKSVDKEKLMNYINDWQFIWRKALLNVIKENRAKKLQKKIIYFIDFLSQAKILLRQNVSPGLVLEEIMLRV